MPIVSIKNRISTIVLLLLLFVFLGSVYLHAESQAHPIITMAGEKEIATYKLQKEREIEIIISNTENTASTTDVETSEGN